MPNAKIKIKTGVATSWGGSEYDSPHYIAPSTHILSAVMKCVFFYLRVGLTIFYKAVKDLWYNQN
jgi:hypothetical protein